MPKRKRPVNKSKRYNSKRSSQRSNSSFRKLKIVSRFNRLSGLRKAVLFAIVFALIGGGIYLWKTLAATLSDGMYGSYETALVNLVNQDRAGGGVAPVTHLECLNAYAE